MLRLKVCTHRGWQNPVLYWVCGHTKVMPAPGRQTWGEVSRVQGHPTLYIVSLRSARATRAPVSKSKTVLLGIRWVAIRQSPEHVLFHRKQSFTKFMVLKVVKVKSSVPTSVRLLRTARGCFISHWKVEHWLTEEGLRFGGRLAIQRPHLFPWRKVCPLLVDQPPKTPISYNHK